MNPDGTTPRGTRVRVTRDIHQFGELAAAAGDVVTVLFRPHGPHATANGGGWDVPVRHSDGRKYLTFKRDAEGNYVKGPGGYESALTASYFTVRSTDLEVVP